MINALVLQESGKLLAAGESDDRFALFRLLANGNVDTGFSPDAPAGIVYTDFSGADDSAEGMTLAFPPAQAKAARGGPTQEQGDPVLAGFTDNNNLGYDFALARYRGND